MRKDNCIFCKIANGEIPSRTLYEDEEFRVILDLGPATKGHALILPKDHYADLFELPEEKAGEVMCLAKRMVMIPRYRADGQTIGWKPQEVSEEELEEVKNQIVD